MRIMKELTIEEKAKAYDEVREKIAIRFGSNVADEIFSPFEMSEDEKIRKCVKYAIDKLFLKEKIVCDVHKEDVIAWLEKQGEHANFRNKIQIGDKVTRNEDGMLVNLSQLNRVAKPAEKQGEQKPVDKVEPKFKVGDIIRLKGSTAEYTIKKVTDTTYYTNGWSCGIERCEEDYELVEQNPAWSEEDEKFFKTALWHISYSVSNGKSTDCHCDTTDWFKSLKERVQPQQEWSKEDDRHLSIAIQYVFQHGYLSTMNWLKSLKDKYTWKPSGKQMFWLTWAINQLPETEKGNKADDVLKELLGQLKKLT